MLKQGEFMGIPYLVGGLEHFLLFHLLGISSSQLTCSHIFQRDRLNHQHHQPDMIPYDVYSNRPSIRSSHSWLGLGLDRGLPSLQVRNLSTPVEVVGVLGQQSQPAVRRPRPPETRTIGRRTIGQSVRLLEMAKR